MGRSTRTSVIVVTVGILTEIWTKLGGCRGGYLVTTVGTERVTGTERLIQGV